MGQTAGGTPVVELLLCRFGGYQAALAGLRNDTAHEIDKGTDRTAGRGGAQPLEHGETPAGLPQTNPCGGDSLSGQGVRKEYKEKRFIHPDIRPYCELEERTKGYDRCISECLPLVAEL